MLVTFSCKVREDIVMFGNVGMRLLEMMGYSGKSSGEIFENDIPVVRERLQKALARETMTDDKRSDDEDSDDSTSQKSIVSLKQRAFPLLDMLDSAEKEKCMVSWKSS